MTPEELRAEVAAGDIDTVVVGFTDHFGRLMGKRFDAEFFVEDALDHGTHGCDYLLIQGRCRAVHIRLNTGSPVPSFASGALELEAGVSNRS